MDQRRPKDIRLQVFAAARCWTPTCDDRVDETPKTSYRDLEAIEPESAHRSRPCLLDADVVVAPEKPPAWHEQARAAVFVQAWTARIVLAPDPPAAPTRSLLASARQPDI